MPDAAFVIVGASLTGATAAATLRKEGFDGRIVLLGEEERLPYERPPLSKDYLRGQSALEAATVHPAGYYDDHGIELIAGQKVVSLDPSGRTVTLAAGEKLAFDRLLLATGCTPRRATMAGAELEGVKYLRDADDADALRARLLERPRVVVIGGGWIGCEVAASARDLGAAVTVVEHAPTLLHGPLGGEMGRMFNDLHAEHEVRVLTGVGVGRIGGAQRVEFVELSDGRRIDADLVVVGIGVIPSTELAETAGLGIDNGIATGERLESSVEGIFAAGDVANAFNPRYGRRLRSEHWANAGAQGALAARAMLGRPGTNDGVPFFFSDQYDLGLEYRGHHRADDELVVRGDMRARELIAFWLRDSRVQAEMNVNVWDAAEELDRLIGSRCTVDRTMLADPGRPLATL